VKQVAELTGQVAEKLLGLEAPVNFHWRHVALTLTLGVALAAGLLPILFEDVAAGEPTVHLKSERRRVRHLRLHRANVAPAMAAPEAASESSRLKQMRKSIMARVQSRSSRWESCQLRPIERSTASSSRRPLLAFVNPRSGGGQGIKVLQELRLLLHHVQVVDLQEESPEAALRWWSKTAAGAQGTQRYRVLICGGDGTVGWILSMLQQLDLEYVPPVAILPLGTGNDLARVCGWGGGFSGGSVAEVLQKVDGAHVALLDRWSVVCRDVLPAGRPASLPDMSLRERKSLVMCNYLGVGVDAAVALDFHQMRERSPHLFVSRLVNKIWYLKSGTVNFFRRACSDLGSKIILECDGVPINVSPHLEGIVVLNINSFAGGSDLWGSAGTASSGEEECEDGSSDDSDEDSEFRELSASGAALSEAKQSMQDKRLDVVGVHGSFQLGAAQVGLYSAVRLAQASHIRIISREPVPVEVDGEPWLFARNGEIDISFNSQAFMLARHGPGGHAVATDVVDWALQQEVISVEQRNKLMREIALRAQLASSADLASMG